MKIKIKKTNYISPLRYPGGKASLAPFFEKVIAKNNLENSTYVEPFAGGAGAALYLLLSGKVKKIVINDLDIAIYSFWKAMLERTDDFISKIQETPVNMEQWRKQKKIYTDKKSNFFDLGFATFFLNRANRSGIIEGGPIGGTKQEGKWKIDARFNKEDLIRRIKKIALLKDKIRILNLDGLDLIKLLKRQKNIFIYLDPPYFKAGESLYLNHYDDKHSELAIFLNENNKLNWILTYDNVKEIKALYKDRNKRTFPINYSARRKRKELELMITSDSLLI